MVQKSKTTNWDVENPVKKKQDKLPSSTGNRRISEPSTVVHYLALLRLGDLI